MPASVAIIQVHWDKPVVTVSSLISSHLVEIRHHASLSTAPTMWQCRCFGPNTLALRHSNLLSRGQKQSLNQTKAAHSLF